MKTLRRRFLYITLLLLFTSHPTLRAASLPDASYGGGYSEQGSVDPMLERTINGGASLGGAGWTYVDQSPAEPWEYWTYTGAPSGFLDGDTIYFADGDSISVWVGSGTYPGFLEQTIITDGGTPLGGLGYYLADPVPLEDATIPLLLFLTGYGFYTYRRKKALK